MKPHKNNTIVNLPTLTQCGLNFPLATNSQSQLRVSSTNVQLPPITIDTNNHSVINFDSLNIPFILGKPNFSKTSSSKVPNMSLSVVLHPESDHGPPMFQQLPYPEVPRSLGHDFLPSNPPNTADTLKSKVENLKKTIKRGVEFKESCNELSILLKESLNNHTKSTFYHALNVVYNRIGKQGYDPKSAQELFDLVLKNINFFTKGYQRNIIFWKSKIDNLSVNPTPAQIQTSFQNPITHSQSNNNSTNCQLKSLVYNFTANEYPYYSDFENLCPLVQIVSQAHNPVCARFQFEITEETFNKIKNAQSRYQVKLGFHLLEITDKYVKTPAFITCSVNSKPVNLLKDPGIFFHIRGCNITDLCILGTNSIVLQRVNIPVMDLCCSVRLVKVNTPEEIARDIESKQKAPYEVSLEDIKSTFVSLDNDIVQVSRRISLRDPITMGRLNIPSRGLNCKHIQCFDLISYITINKNHPKFSCPVCSTHIPLTSIVVDAYFAKALDTNKDAEEIQIEIDGSFKFVEPVRTGVCDDDDDEDSDEEVFNNLKRKRETKALDEIMEPPRKKQCIEKILDLTDD